MDYISDEGFEQLKCIICQEYLSCGPVYVKHTGEAICGRCEIPTQPVTRNIHYEEVARHYLFPCKYKILGCKETYFFKNGFPDHEKVCIYREFACPVSEPGQCSWRGGKDNLLTHCKEQHQDYVLITPYSVSCKDLLAAGTSVRTFVLTAYEQVFLMHLTTSPKKICYNVQSLEGKETADMFKFLVDINHNNEIKAGYVAPSGYLEYKYDTVNIDILEDYSKMKFIISIKKLVKCTRCRRYADKYVIEDNDIKLCDRCISLNFRKCYSCSFENTYIKINEHKRFCSLCYICWKPKKSILNHCKSVHKEMIHKSGSIWQCSKNSLSKKCYIDSDVGLIFCEYYLDTYEWVFTLYSPLKITELYNTIREIVITDPVTKCRHTYTLPTKYFESYDWKLTIKPHSDFQDWSGTLDISVPENTKVGCPFLP